MRFPEGAGLRRGLPADAKEEETAMREAKWFRGITVVWAGVILAGSTMRVLADCSSFGLPFTDLGSTAFCAQIAEAYYAGLSNGTTATTYSPAANVPREQMAAFVTRTLDQSLLRGSRRASLDQWWTTTPHYDLGLGTVSVGGAPRLLESDGADVWVANNTTGTVTRIQASSGKVLGTWTGADSASAILIAMGKVSVTGAMSPGALYEIDPTGPPGPVTTVEDILPDFPAGIAFDGNKIWTADAEGFVSIITPGTWAVTNKSGFTEPVGIVFDGTRMWVTDSGADQIDKLNSDGSIATTTPVGHGPNHPAFDGANIWVPNVGGSLTVVRASDGTVLRTFSSANGNRNGLSGPISVAFDGQRVLVTNQTGSLSLFHATDLSPLGVIATPGLSLPYGVCSDGVNFWVSFEFSNKIGVF